MQNYLTECNKQRCSILFTRSFRNGGGKMQIISLVPREGENVVYVPARVLHDVTYKQ